MEELSAALALGVSLAAPNSPAAPHPRLAAYKPRGGSGQAERRQRLLRLQRERRLDYVNHARRLAEDDWAGVESEGEEEEEKNEEEEEMDVDTGKKLPKRYANQLMLSEWLVDVPLDLEQEWVVVVCPVGKRALVVASRVSGSKGFHLAFARWVGQSLEHSSTSPVFVCAVYCILDCIYSEVKQTYYILDVMCWRGHPVYDCQDSQVFLLRAALQQVTPNLSWCRGLFLPRCSTQHLPFLLLVFFQVDGLLFYHKQTHYTPGSTPLVGWLRPYMVPEILGLAVPATALTTKPDYAGRQLQQIIQSKKSKKLAAEKGQPNGHYELEHLSTPQAVTSPQGQEEAGSLMEN
uniref:Snurportin-1 n=1 Tax=Calidris pygmaea TaxID=425635 RepID=A0A8C3J5F0_9CHAR